MVVHVLNTSRGRPERDRREGERGPDACVWNWGLGCGSGGVSCREELLRWCWCNRGRVDALEALFFSLLGFRVGCSASHAESRMCAGGGVDTISARNVDGAKAGDVGVKSWHCEVGDMGAEDTGVEEEATYECLRCGVPF